MKKQRIPHEEAVERLETQLKYLMGSYPKGHHIPALSSPIMATATPRSPIYNPNNPNNSGWENWSYDFNHPSGYVFRVQLDHMENKLTDWQIMLHRLTPHPRGGPNDWMRTDLLKAKTFTEEQALDVVMAYLIRVK